MRIKNEYICNVADNIARYYEKEVALGERMSANMSELSVYVAEAAAKEARLRGFFGGDSPLLKFMPPVPNTDNAVADALGENSVLVSAKLSASEGAYLADFCKKTAIALRRNSRLRLSPALFAESITTEGGGRVSYTESNVLKEAFRVFSSQDSSLAASYVLSFAAACEDVAAGVSEYCILPIENTREGVLPTMYALIDRYDLFISRVCVIENGDFFTKFALLCKGFRGTIVVSESQYVSLRLSVSDAAVWSKLYTGASVIGAELKCGVSVPLGYTDGYAHICTFSGSSEELFAFLLFLGTIRAGYTLIGAYEIY